VKYLLITLLVLCGFTPTDRPIPYSNTQEGNVIFVAWTNGDYNILPNIEETLK